MFERFTPRARQVVVLAQDEARGLRHDYIGTEHLLLGLLREEDGLAARTLESFGVPIDEARADVARMVGTGDEVPATGQIPFTPRAKRALERAAGEATAMNHDFVGTEHLLLGLARDEDGVAMQILHEHGVDGAAAHEAVVRRLGGAASGPAAIDEPTRNRLARRTYTYRPRLRWWNTWHAAFALGALTLGVGVLIGWAISH